MRRGYSLWVIFEVVEFVVKGAELICYLYRVHNFMVTLLRNETWDSRFFLGSSHPPSHLLTRFVSGMVVGNAKSFDVLFIFTY